ncbi:phage tail tape measure protein [Streptomyces antibioticus]|uniref:phage tail tape measure protein n=1 Tax=Streptomyces antibioticus TaxID=1890 RepID=UPI0033EC4965
MATTAIVYALIGRDRASATFRQVGRSANRLASTTSKAGAAIKAGLAVGAVGVAGLAAATLKAAGDFEKSMNQVRAVTGATGKEFKALRDQAKELGATTKFTAKQAADAQGFLAMAGFRTLDIMSAMPGVLDLASAGNMDLARSADIASNILTGYGMKAEETSRVVDVMAKTFTSTNTNLEQLGEAFKYAGPVAHAAGIRFEQASAAIGLMGNAGIQASMAGTALRGAVTRLLAPTKQIRTTLDKLGVTVKDTHGKLLPLDDIIRQLEKSGATTGDMMTLFGQRAGPAMLALVDQGSGALVKLTDKLDKAGGTADRIAKIQMEGLQGQLVALKSAWEGLLIEIGDTGVLAGATKALSGVTVAVRDLSGWVNDGIPKVKAFGHAVVDIVPVEQIRTRFTQAKTMVSDFFTGLTGTKKAAKDLMGGLLDSSPHLGSGKTGAAAKGPALAPKPHYGVGQVAPATGVKGPALAPMPHGGSGLTAPLAKAKTVPPKSTAQKLGEQIRSAVTGGISAVDWTKVGEKLGSALGTSFQWLAKNGAKLAKQLVSAMASLDWVDIGKQVGGKTLGFMIGFIASFGQELFSADFWKKHFWDTVIAALSLFGIGKIAGPISKVLSKIPILKMFAPLFSGLSKITAPISKVFGKIFKFIGSGLWKGLAKIFPRGAAVIEREAGLITTRLGVWGLELLEKGKGALKFLGTGFLKGATWVLSKVGELLGLILKPFAKPAGWLVSKGTALVKGFGRGLLTAAKGIGGLAKRIVIDPLVGVFRSAGTWLLAKGSALVSGFKSGAIRVATGIGGFGKKWIVDPVVGAFKSAGTWLLARGSALVSGFKSGAIRVAKGIGGFGKKWVIDPVVGAFRAAGTWLLAKGGALVSGFKAGAIGVAKGIAGWTKTHVISPVTGAFSKAGSWLTAKGTALISGLKSGIIGAIKGVGSWIKKSVVDPVVNAVKSYFGIRSPSKVFEGIGGHLVAGLFKGLAKTSGGAIARKIFGDMPSALGSIVKKGLVSVSSLPGKALKALGGLGSKLGDIFGSLFGGGGGGGKGGGTWAPLVSQVLAMLGAPGSALQPVLKRIQMESGGNPMAINLWDSNAKAGDPSRGLMQTIGSTFNAYAGPFKSRGIYDPLANIYAGVNYAMHRYGKNWVSVMTRPGGYATGGLAPVGQTAWVGEKGAELMQVTSRGARIFSHKDSMAMAGQMGIKLPGYASGTVGNAQAKVNQRRAELERAQARKYGVQAAKTRLKAAQQELANAKRRTRTAVDNALTNGFRKTLATGTASAIASAVKSMVGKLQNAGASKSFVNSVLGKSDKLQSLAAKKASVTSRIAEAKQFAADQSAGIKDFLSVSGTSASSVKDLISQMTGQQKTARSLSTLTGSLKERGASAALLEQLAAAGPGSQLAAILGDRGTTTKDISRLNSLVASGNKLADAFGRTMADTMYDSGSQAAKGFLTGLAAQEKSLAKAMEKLADALITSIKKKLKIKSPSRVFRDQVGKMIALGTAKGIDTHTSSVVASAQNMANAAAGISTRRVVIPSPAGTEAARQAQAVRELAAAVQASGGTGDGQLTGELRLDSGELLGMFQGVVRPMIKASEKKMAYEAKVGPR